MQYPPLGEQPKKILRIVSLSFLRARSFVSRQRPLLLRGHNNLVVRCQPFPLPHGVQVLPGDIGDAEVPLFPFVLSLLARLGPPERIQLHHLFRAESVQVGCARSKKKYDEVTFTPSRVCRSKSYEAPRQTRCSNFPPLQSYRVLLPCPTTYWMLFRHTSVRTLWTQSSLHEQKNDFPQTHAVSRGVKLVPPTPTEN